MQSAHSAVRAGILVLLIHTPLEAQRQEPQKIALSSVITAFLVDSGVRTRGLPWTTGSNLPIRWTSPGPVTNPDTHARNKGVTHARTGTFIGTIDDSVTLEMSITLTGTAQALAGMSVTPASLHVTKADGSGFITTREMIEAGLKAAGLTFQPIKCKRETEGASYGNLVDAVKAPGKTASGLWWFWQSPQQEPTVTLTLLYRRADMAQIECYSG